MSVNGVKLMICKFEATGSLNVAPGRGRSATATATVEAVAIATAEATARSSNDTVNGRSIIRVLDILWATVRMILRKIPKLYSYKLQQ